MTEETPKVGKIRLQIYTMIREIIGREITEKEHAMLKAVLNQFRAEVTPKLLPLEHKFICGKCGGVREGRGKKFNRKIKTRYNKE